MARVLSKADFDAESFVKKQLNCSVLSNVDELENLRRQVGRLKGETSVALKKNVYKHYSQFIDTAKEISILEGEMYQMSHLLTEQKNIVNAITELSLSDHKDQKNDSDKKGELNEFSSRVGLSFLLEKVEGCCPLNKSSSTTQLIHEGDVVELDVDSHLPLSRSHLFLLSDSLLVASCLPETKGTFEYKFEALYELYSVAVVNVKEAADLSCAFKVLVFPSSRLFSAPSAKLKKKWIEVLDEWKKTTVPLHRPTHIPGNNPFESEGEGKVGVVEEWVMDAPEDLDVLVAQRDFEGAVDLVIKVNLYLDQHPNIFEVKDFRPHMDHRVKKLTDSLVVELSVSAERSIRGGLRGLRRMVVQLLRLGKTSLACELFLANRSKVCHHVLKQLTNESEAVAYVSKLCECFYGNLAGVCEEFKLVFAEHHRCYSAFILWSEGELAYFCSLFSKQVFESKISFSAVVACVGHARKGCRKLSDAGVDLLFLLDDLLTPELLTRTQAAGDTQMEAIKHRAVDDKWRPVNFQRKESLERFGQEMREMGFQGVTEFYMDDSHTFLSTNTIEFSKAYRSFSRLLISLHCTQLHHCILEGLQDIAMLYGEHIIKATNNPIFNDSLPLIRKNAQFVAREVVDWVVVEFQGNTGSTLPHLTALQHKLLKI